MITTIGKIISNGFYLINYYYQLIIGNILKMLLPLVAFVMELDLPADLFIEEEYSCDLIKTTNDGIDVEEEQLLIDLYGSGIPDPDGLLEPNKIINKGKTRKSIYLEWIANPGKLTVEEILEQVNGMEEGLFAQETRVE